MASVHEIKCPSCGAENGPCLVENGIPMYHTARTHAAYPTTYEHPDCGKCRELKDAMVGAEESYRTCRPDFGEYRPKSRWPQAWKDEYRRRENAANLSRANYEFHLGTDHMDENESRDHNLVRNLQIILREGRLKP
jgi:hypothetical protein